MLSLVSPMISQVSTILSGQASFFRHGVLTFVYLIASNQAHLSL